MYVLRVRRQLQMVVPSSKPVAGGKSGYYLQDHANVLPTLCGMEMHAYQIRVPLAKDGIFNLDHASASITQLR